MNNLLLINQMLAGLFTILRIMRLTFCSNREFLSTLLSLYFALLVVEE